MTTFSTFATATYANGNIVVVQSAENMIPGLPITFSGNTFGNLTTNATYYIGNIVFGFPTSNITLTSLPGGAVYSIGNGSGNMVTTFSQGGQQIIPTVPPGEPLNVAFDAINVNFDQIFAAGPVGSNIQIDENTIYTLNTNGNLVLNPNGIGNVIANAHVIPDQDRVRNLGAPALRWNTIYAQNIVGNIAGNIVAGGANGDIQFNNNGILGGSNGFTYNNATNAVSISGNLTAANVAAGNIVASGTAYLYNISSGGVSSLTTIQAATLSASGNITGNYFFGNGSQLTGIDATSIQNGNSNVRVVSAGGNVAIGVGGTSNVVVIANTGQFVNGIVSATGGFYGDIYTTLIDSGDSSAILVIPDVVMSASLTVNQDLQVDNEITAVGNITGNYFFGNGSLLTGIITSVSNINNGTSNVTIGNPNGNVTMGVGGVNNVMVVSPTDVTINGNLTVTGNATLSGNILGDRIQNGNTQIDIQTAGGNANVTVGGVSNVAVFATTGLFVTGLASVSGNISGNYFFGNGSQLTGITADNVNADDLIGNTLSGNVLFSSLTSVGTLSNLSVAGTVTVGNISIPSSGNVLLGNVNINNLANPVANSDAATKFYVDSVAANVLPIITNQTITPNGSANTFVLDQSTTAVGILVTINGVTQTPTVDYTVTGNSITIGETPLSSDIIQVRYLSGTTTGGGGGTNYANANVVAYAESGWGGNIIPQGNLVYNLGNSTNRWNDLYLSGNTIYLDSATIGANGADVTFSGNVSANYITGNGSQLTGITATANTGNVTFSDVNIIGDGNLNLQPNGSASEYLNIYLTGAADIHVAYGGGSGNVILGTDEQANVAVLLDGNVAIQAGNVSGTQTWTFDTAGNLTLPMDSVVYETNIPDGALSGSAIALKPAGGTTANQQLLIYPTANDGDHIHLTSGNLYATELFLGSDNLYVKLANTGNIVINSNDGNSSNAMWTFGNDGTTTFPAGNITSNTSLQFTTTFANVKTVEYQTAGVWDLYVEDSITGSNIATSRLSVSFKDNLIDKPQVYIENTKESDGVALRWTFDENGSLNFPRDAVGNTDPYLTITGGANPRILSEDASLAGPANLEITALNTVFTGNNGEAITIYPDDGEISGDANIQIWSNAVGNTQYSWTFDTTGNLTTPGGMIINGNVNTLGTQTALLQPTDDLPLSFISSGANGTVTSFWAEDFANLMASNIAAIYTPLQNTQTVRIVTGTNGGNVAIYDFDPDGMFTATAVCATGNVYAGNVSASGNVTGNYILGNGSQLTNLPAPAVTQDITSNGAMSIMLYDSVIKYNNYATVEPSSGNITGGNILTGGLISATGNVTGNYFIGNGSQLTGLPTSYGDANVANLLAAFGSNTISTSGNVTAGNLIGNISITGNVTGTSANVTLVAGSYSTVFDNTGNLTLPGNTFAVNYANNTPVDVVTRFESTWTVPTGNSTQSFTVSSGTYSMWVEGNIPNGIIVWNATGTVTNTNVPVAGVQYAWVYNGGGTPIDFTSIPNQFVGTANTIVRSNVAPSATTNRFDFGINNTSGGNVTVRYGWIQIS